MNFIECQSYFRQPEGGTPLRRLFLSFILAMSFGGGGAWAQCTSYPNILVNGSAADANQVMANFNCAALLGSAHFSGNVGIGTTAPVANLDLNAPTPAIQLDNSNANNSEDSISLVTKSDGSYIGTQNNQGWLVVARGNAFQTTNQQNDLGFFYWNQSYYNPVLYLGHNGNVGLGVAPANGRFSISNNISGGGPNSSYASYQAILFDSGAANSSYGLGIESGNMWLNSGGGYKFYINNSADVVIAPSGFVGIGTTSPGYNLQVSGTAAGSGAWINLSDGRLKKNIKPIGEALNLVQQLQGVRFSWRAANERTIGRTINLPVGQRQIGLIAQDVSKILPEAVAVSKAGAEDIYGLKEGDLVPVLIEAIKQQQSEIRSQSAAIKRLKAALSVINARIR